MRRGTNTFPEGAVLQALRDHFRVSVVRLPDSRDGDDPFEVRRHRNGKLKRAVWPTAVEAGRIDEDDLEWVLSRLDIPLPQFQRAYQRDSGHR